MKCVGIYVSDECRNDNATNSPAVFGFGLNIIGFGRKSLLSPEKIFKKKTHFECVFVTLFFVFFLDV